MKKTIATIGVTLGVCILFFVMWMQQELPYCTQHIYYRSKENPEITIELQMQDIGAHGYNRRMVKVRPGRIEDIVEPIDTNTLDKSLWTRVDEEVNELGLKSP